MSLLATKGVGVAATKDAGVEGASFDGFLRVKNV
jgi:hypothetical protein